MAEIDTQFMTKTAEKPHTFWGRTYSLYSRLEKGITFLRQVIN